MGIEPSVSKASLWFHAKSTQDCLATEPVCACQVTYGCVWVIHVVYGFIWQSTLEDYDAMPVGDFGAAMLRGMGWKKGEAIGGVNKGWVEDKV